MSSQRYSELKECEEARRELRELNAELLERLKSICFWAKGWNYNQIPPNLLDPAIDSIAKAEKFK